MLRFLADENFNNQIVRGLVRRNSDVDIVRSFTQSYFTQKQRRDKFPQLAIPSQLTLGK